MMVSRLARSHQNSFALHQQSDGSFLPFLPSIALPHSRESIAQAVSGQEPGDLSDDSALRLGDRMRETKP